MGTPVHRGKLVHCGQIAAYGRITPEKSRNFSLSNSLPLVLGYCREYWTYHLDGKLDDVAVWDHARTAEQIQADMGGLTGAESGLVGYWPFEEALDCQVILDHSIYANHGVLGRTADPEACDPTRVPEPATVGLLLLGGLAALRRSRRTA